MLEGRGFDLELEEEGESLVCAPRGERHGKGKKYPDWLVQAVIMEHIDFGEPVQEISRILSIPERTINDWIGFRTRVVH